MATAWLKSLQCKSSAFDDVVYSPKPKKPLLPSSASAACSNSSQALRDVVFLFPNHSSLPKIPPEKQPNPPKSHPKRAKPKSTPNKLVVPPSSGPTPPQFPTLTELHAGHSSRRVVEIIFGSSWSGRFPGRVEMLFRVHNPARTVARFKEYRSAVRSRSAASEAAAPPTATR